MRSFALAFSSSAPAAEDGVEAVLLQHPQERVGLQAVAGGAGDRLFDDRAAMSCCTDPRTRRTPRLATCLSRYSSTSGKFWPRVDVHDREGDALRPARLGGEV